jgi:hypothetical protein
MKKFNLLVLLFVSSILFSCSSSDDSDTTTPTDETSYFNYKLNSQTIPVASWTALRSENNFEVLGEVGNGRSIYVSFDNLGHIIRVGTTPEIGSSLPWQNNFFDFSANYFSLQVVSIDDINKKVKVNFSGKVYDNDFDITSAFSNVEGSFNVNYIDVAPQIAGLGVTAKLNGADWKSVKSTQSASGSFQNLSLEHNSDDIYKISILMNSASTSTGTYTFNGASSTNKVILSKYNIATNQYIDYVCTGTFVLTQKQSNTGYVLISGTYSFTAVNPIDNTQIQVTSGTFKTTYD